MIQKKVPEPNKKIRYPQWSEIPVIAIMKANSQSTECKGKFCLSICPSLLIWPKNTGFRVIFRHHRYLLQ